MIEEFTSYEKAPTFSYEKVENPVVFIGTLIKSQYDEHRISIKDSSNAKRISHCNRFFYGATFELMREHRLMVKKLKNVQHIDLYTYNKIILENGLSCNDNFIYLEDGLYPLDEKHICQYIENFEYNLFLIFLNIENESLNQYR